ncbi:MAG TPA: efflux RND transporter permease subunit [Gammaproteobacteria bacterium]|nr:efflux RND transporter permease subunit [Gammaproteobacteria bacterium]
MSWPRFSLRYRYTIFALLIGVVVLGVTARFGIPIQLFPDTDPPVVTVITPYPGAAAVDTAKNLSKVMEEEFAGLDGVARITSTSQTGLSVVKVQFHYGIAVGEAAVDVQNAIDRIGGGLPRGIGEPQVLEFSSSDRPVLTLAVAGEDRALSDVRELADNALHDRLQRVQGVSNVDVFGAHKRQLEVRVERQRLAAYDLTLDRLARTLDGWNLTESGGRVDRGAQEAVVRFDMPLGGPRDAAALVVAHQGDRKVRLADVAEVSLGTREARSAYHFNGEQAIALQVLKRDEANTVEVAARVRAELERLRADFPHLTFRVADDDSEFTELVISNMTTSVLTAIVLVIGVVFLFLADLRQAAIIALSIPVAFLLTFSLMWAAGIELNMVTMSAIILAIGLLVDDGIVVLENVHRHMASKGKSPVRAAVDGTEEILLADVAGTTTTVSVLIPLAFLGGFVGKLFGPMAWTLTFALSASLLVSITLIPLLTALWLHADDEGSHGRLARLVSPFHRFLDGVREGYLALLQGALRHPWWTVGAAVLLLVVSLRVMVFIGSEMLPKFDSGNFQVLMDTVPGMPLEATLERVDRVEALLLKEPEVVGVSTQVGYEAGGHYLGDRGAMDVNQAQITVNLTPRTGREESQWQIMDRVRAGIAQVPGIHLAVLKEKGGTARSTTTAPVDVRISGPEPAVLDRLGSAVLERVQGVPGVRDAYKNWGLDTPQLAVTIDRERAAEFGFTGREVTRAVYDALEGRAVTPFRQDRRRDLQVHLRYTGADRRDLQDLSDVLLRGPDGAAIPLREVARLEMEYGPRIVTREDLRQTLDVLGYQYGRPLSETVADVERALADLTVPAAYTVAITGEQRDFQQARERMLRALALGILAVYLVLVAQFRSFKHPVTIMAAVPLQFIGVVAALLIAGKYLSMPALLGVILLTGTVINNSIVLVDYILQRRRAGMEMEAAIADAVRVRYRPIMMTAFSDVVGMLPLALELAVGAERFSPIATVVIGGILAATLLTLVVVPVLFRLLERLAPTREDRFAAELEA